MNFYSFLPVTTGFSIFLYVSHQLYLLIFFILLIFSFYDNFLSVSIYIFASKYLYFCTSFKEIYFYSLRQSTDVYLNYWSVICSGISCLGSYVGCTTKHFYYNYEAFLMIITFFLLSFILF